MCGVSGFVNLRGEPAELGVLRAMTESISHRGPDGDGVWIDKNIAIGHRRLSVLDLSQAGRQPMQSLDGRYVISYNGEIYNFLDLRERLQELGYYFRSRTDTEVVLYSFSEWGLAALDKFNGMFAFALWDAHERKLLLARDRYGIKPRYFAFQSGRFYFGSEQKSIYSDKQFVRRLNKGALFEYLNFQNIFSDQTLVKDISLLPAGHFAILDEKTGTWNVSKYWDYEFTEPSGVYDEKEYEEELRRLFSQAVNRQLVSDVELGSYLSGGIDSGAISAVASRRVPNLKTFTVGFDLSSASGLELGYDERDRAEAMSALLKTEHYEMVLKSGDMERCLPLLVHHLEEPRVGQSYPNFYASKLASKFVKVVLSGSGGDELFGGYPWRYFPATDSRDFDEFTKGYFSYWQRMLTNVEMRSLFEPIWGDVRHIDALEIFRNVFPSHQIDVQGPEAYLNQCLYFEAKTFLHGLLVVEDKLSMAHGLETRVPFLDNDLVDFAMSCPVALKLSFFNSSYRPDENEVLEKRNYSERVGMAGKQIVRNALRKYFGTGAHLARKQGFSSPDSSWFRGESLRYVERLLSRVSIGSSALSVLSGKVIKDLVRQHTSGEKNRRLLIWSLIFLANLKEEGTPYLAN
jgi:asparagine synthase (glutamine-hydrolysing)